MKLGKVGVIVAARMRSTRLPGKALLPLQGIPMILFLLRRLSCLSGGMVVLATTQLSSDDRLAEVVAGQGIPVFRDADADVVARYVATAEHFKFETVVRVTGDCPFVDADLVDWCLGQAKTTEYFDLATTKGQFPVGLDVEIYRAALMARLHESGKLSPTDREHLTLYLYNHGDEYAVCKIEPRNEWATTKRHFTVDTRADYDAASALAAHFSSPEFSVSQLMAKTV